MKILPLILKQHVKKRIRLEIKSKEIDPSFISMWHEQTFHEIRNQLPQEKS